ncbi:MAG: beta-lactamase family protein [Planctomycetes bacterium]|nr:beta-lactamase family protein [Planctomycetota bacterium]
MDRKSRYLIYLLSVAPEFGVAQESAPQSRTASAEAAKRVGDAVEGFVKKGFSGAVWVRRGGDLLYERAHGLADKAKNARCTIDTVFDIGSITKQFTAAAILKLETMKKLSTDDAIVKFFPGAPADKRKITIHQLLTHTAGYPEEFGPDYEKLGRDALVARAMAAKLESEPGAKYNYSNVGYSLLAAIVETVSGASYERFLHDQLFVPAGMKRTGYLLPKFTDSDLARGYRGEKVFGSPLEHPWAADGPYWNLRGNGGILSTGRDMLLWDGALRGDAVLPAEARKKMFTPYVAEGPERRSFYGYGWVVLEKTPNGKLYTHNGGNGFFFADYYRFVDSDSVIFIASNAQFPEGEEMGPSIARALFERK